MVGGRDDLMRMFMRVRWSTVSKAFVKSKATITVRCGGRFWLKPVMTWLERLVSALVVEWFGLNPC